MQILKSSALFLWDLPNLSPFAFWEVNVFPWVTVSLQIKLDAFDAGGRLTVGEDAAWEGARREQEFSVGLFTTAL